MIHNSVRSPQLSRPFGGKKVRVDTMVEIEQPNDSNAPSASTPAQDALRRLLSWLGAAEVVFGLSPSFDFENGVVIVDLTKEKSRERLVADAPQYQFSLYPPKPSRKISVGFASGIGVQDHSASGSAPSPAWIVTEIGEPSPATPENR